MQLFIFMTHILAFKKKKSIIMRDFDKYFQFLTC